MNRQEIAEEFGLTSQLEIMKACVRIAMAQEMLNDMDNDKFPTNDKEILRQGCMRLLENNDLTGLQNTLRQRYYFDPKPKDPNKAS